MLLACLLLSFICLLRGGGEGKKGLSSSIQEEMNPILYTVGKNFVVHQFNQEPMISFTKILSRLKTFVCVTHNLVTRKQFCAFIDAGGYGHSLNRYFDDKKRDTRRFLLTIFQHGGSERFTFGAVSGLSIFHKFPPVLGTTMIGDEENLEVIVGTMK